MAKSFLLDAIASRKNYKIVTASATIDQLGGQSAFGTTYTMFSRPRYKYRRRNKDFRGKYNIICSSPYSGVNLVEDAGDGSQTSRIDVDWIDYLIYSEAKTLSKAAGRLTIS